MTKLERKYIQFAAILGLLGILLGAFAAHGLKTILSSEILNSFQTGVRYQFYHTFFILAIIPLPLSKKIKQLILKTTILGVSLFSGSIYLLCLAPHFLNWELPKIIGLITPIGGICLALSWGILFWAAFKAQNDPS